VHIDVLLDSQSVTEILKYILVRCYSLSDSVPDICSWFFLYFCFYRIPTEKILPYGLKENFWMMGETGPCGPCTEIHFAHHGCSEKSAYVVNTGSPDVIELWNLVFMQFDRCVVYFLTLNSGFLK